MAILDWHSVRRVFVRLVVATVLLGTTSPAAVQSFAGAEEPAPDETAAQAAERKQLRDQMSARMSQVKVAPVDAPDKQGKLMAKPLMSYTDQPLSINGATLWAWSQQKNGRPIAVCKIEHYDRARREVQSEWLYCFVSLSSGLIHAGWPDGHEWTARQPGISFRDVPDGPVPGETPAARARQLKDLARHFTASREFGKGTREELRLLTQPVYSYANAETGVIEGAVFAASMNGTNPTALFLIELQQTGDQQLWKFAIAAMTDAGVIVKWDDKEVWSKQAIHAPGKDFDTWTYFFEKRSSD
jgi:hypothetical protein